MIKNWVGDGFSTLIIDQNIDGCQRAFSGLVISGRHHSPNLISYLYPMDLETLLDRFESRVFPIPQHMLMSRMP